MILFSTFRRVEMLIWKSPSPRVSSYTVSERRDWGVRMSQAAEGLLLEMTWGRRHHFTVRKLLSKYSVLCGLRAISRVVR